MPGSPHLESKIIVTSKSIPLFGRRAGIKYLPDKKNKLAEYILRGEEKDVEYVLQAVKENPDLLHSDVIYEAEDKLKRKVKGTLLQIAAMAGDVSFSAEIKDGNKRGLVEQLAEAGNLTREEVAQQLSVVTSDEAKMANAARNKKIIDALVKFSKGIIAKAHKYDGCNFNEFQKMCAPVINKFATALTPDSKETITSGYIFDPFVLHQAVILFTNNLKCFGGFDSLVSNVFRINGFGILQSMLSSRDAQIACAGIGRLIEDNQVPGRSLQNANGKSYFFDPSSLLGRFLYLGYFGEPVRKEQRQRSHSFLLPPAAKQLAMYGRFIHDNWRKLCEIKEDALENLCNADQIQTMQITITCP